jgi:hypothetical protein
VLLIAAAVLTSSIAAYGSTIVYAQSYGGIGGIGGPLGVGGPGGLGGPSAAGSGKPIFPLRPFHLALCSSPAKSQLTEPCISVPKGSGNFTFICEPTSIVSFACISVSPTAFQQALMSSNTTSTSSPNIMSSNTTSTSSPNIMSSSTPPTAATNR